MIQTIALVFGALVFGIFVGYYICFNQVDKWEEEFVNFMEENYRE